MTKPKRRWRTFTEELEELERTDLDVRRAAENYDRVVAEILREAKRKRERGRD